MAATQIPSSYNFTIVYNDGFNQDLKVVIKDFGDNVIYENPDLATDTTYTITSAPSAGTYDIEYYLFNGTDWDLDFTEQIDISEYLMNIDWYWSPPGIDYNEFVSGDQYDYIPDAFTYNNTLPPSPVNYPSQIKFQQYELKNEVWELEDEITKDLSTWDDQNKDYNLVTFTFTFNGYPTKIVTTVSNSHHQIINDTYVDQEYLFTAVDATNLHSEEQTPASYTITFNYTYGNADGQHPNLIITPENNEYTKCNLYLYKNSELIHSYMNLGPNVYYPFEFSEASKSSVVYKVRYSSVNTNTTESFYEEFVVNVREYKPEFNLPVITCKQINENAAIALSGLRFNCFQNDSDLHFNPLDPEFTPVITFSLYYLNTDTYNWELQLGYPVATEDLVTTVDGYIDDNPNITDSLIGQQLQTKYYFGSTDVQSWIPNKLTMVKLVVAVTNYSTTVTKEVVFPICGTWKIRRMSCNNYRIYNYTQNQINFSVTKINEGNNTSLPQVVVGPLSFETLTFSEDGVFEVVGGGLSKYIFNFCSIEACILELQKKVLLDDTLCDACKMDKVLYQKALRLIPLYETWKKLLDKDWVYEIQYQSTDIDKNLSAIYDANELYEELKNLCSNCESSSSKCNCK